MLADLFSNLWLPAVVRYSQGHCGRNCRRAVLLWSNQVYKQLLCALIWQICQEAEGTEAGSYMLDYISIPSLCACLTQLEERWNRANNRISDGADISVAISYSDGQGPKWGGLGPGWT